MSESISKSKVLLSPCIIQSRSKVPARSFVATSKVKVLLPPVTSTLKFPLSAPCVLVGSVCILKVLLSPSNSKKPVKVSAVISPKNLLVSPIWFISNVIVAPSRSRGVIEPAAAVAPPIMFEEPSCSMSRLKVAPTWSTYTSLSA